MKNLFGSIGLALAVFACGGSSSKMNAAPATPAAMANIDAREGDNGNTKLEVEVQHLAPPASVAQDASVYVVWAKPHAGDPTAQNLGALQVDSDRKGKLETTTALRSFDVVITPESSSQVTKPSHDPVLTGKVER